MLDQRQRVGLTAGGLLDFLAHKTGPITKGQRLPAPLQHAFDRFGCSTGTKGIQLTWASPLQLILRCHRLTEPTTGTLLLVERQTTEATLVDKLSTREREVLELRAEGLTTHAIASTLNLSEGTVRTFFQRAYTKLGVHSDAAAIDLLRWVRLF